MSLLSLYDVVELADDVMASDEITVEAAESDDVDLLQTRLAEVEEVVDFKTQTKGGGKKLLLKVGKRLKCDSLKCVITCFHLMQPTMN